VRNCLIYVNTHAMQLSVSQQAWQAISMAALATVRLSPQPQHMIKSVASTHSNTGLAGLLLTVSTSSRS
jgi:hypothetical protein